MRLSHRSLFSRLQPAPRFMKRLLPFLPILVCLPGLASAQSYSYDNGSTENALSMNGAFQPGELAMIHGFDSGTGDVIGQIEVAVGTALAGSGGLDGTPLTVAIWDDPTNDFNPSDAVLLWSSTGLTVTSSHADTKVAYVTAPTPVSGVFYIGAVMQDTGGFPVGLDMDSPSIGSAQAWIVGEGPSTPLNLNQLGSSGFSLSFQTNAVFLLSATSSDQVGLTNYCAGDGTGVVGCPCGNVNASGSDGGCTNSTGLGATLSATGTGGLAADDLTLISSQAPANRLGLFYSGLSPSEVFLGDGLRCVSQGIRRSAVSSSGPAGVFTLNNALISGNLSAGASDIGQTRYIQCWYRDTTGPCGTGFNFSIAGSIQVAP